MRKYTEIATQQRDDTTPLHTSDNPDTYKITYHDLDSVDKNTKIFPHDTTLTTHTYNVRETKCNFEKNKKHRSQTFFKKL